MLPSVMFGTGFNPAMNPLFGAKKGGTTLVVNAPDVTENHRKQYRVGDVVAFDRGNFRLTRVKGAKGDRLKWVTTHDQPKQTPYTGKKAH